MKDRNLFFIDIILPLLLRRPAKKADFNCALSGLQAGKAISLEQEILPGFIARGGRCCGMPRDGRFFDIGLPHDYYQAANIVGDA